MAPQEDRLSNLHNYGPVGLLSVRAFYFWIWPFLPMLLQASWLDRNAFKYGPKLSGNWVWRLVCCGKGVKMSSVFCEACVTFCCVSVTFCYLLSGGFCERDHPGISKVCKRWRQYNPPLGHQPFSCDGQPWRRPLLSIETQWHHLLSKGSLGFGVEFA